MRKDMHKVIVERRRHGGGVRTPKGSVRDAQRRLRADGELPEREPVRRPWLRHAPKQLNENLGPLKRFLAKQVGRPWESVHAELSETISVRNAVQKHVLDHLRWIVHVDCELVGARVFALAAHKRRFALRDGELYVDPRTRILRRAKVPRTKPSEPERERVDLGPDRCLLRFDGLWYEVELARVERFLDRARGGLVPARTRASPADLALLPAGARDAFLPSIACVPDGEDRWRVLGPGAKPSARSVRRSVEAPELARLYGDPGRFARSKRQAGSRRLREHGLANDPGSA